MDRVKDQQALQLTGRKFCCATAAFCLSLSLGCGPIANNPKPGPDKQGTGLFYGAALGAGSGAVTGAQLAAGAGPGAWVGGGLGAIYGMFTGLGTDLLEEDQLRRADEEKDARQLAWAQEVLSEHYARRMELHPSRDIYPADLFFDQDNVELRCDAGPLVHEIARLTRRRMPWSRIVVASYSTAKDPDSSYARYLNTRRAEELAREFVQAGMEGRRVLTQAVTLPEPILIDPYDSPSRYRTAIEIIPLDY